MDYKKVLSVFALFAFLSLALIDLLTTEPSEQYRVSSNKDINNSNIDLIVLCYCIDIAFSYPIS